MRNRFLGVSIFLLSLTALILVLFFPKDPTITYKLDKTLQTDTYLTIYNADKINAERAEQEKIDTNKKYIKHEYENIKMKPSSKLPNSIKNADKVSELVRQTHRDLTSREGHSKRYLGVFTATAYDSSYPDSEQYGKSTSKMVIAKEGITVAVDPSVIPYFTRLRIETMDGTPIRIYAVAHDCGGAIKGRKIDIYFNDGNEVKKFGKQKVKVYMYD